jgi:hypothetical protein
MKTPDLPRLFPQSEDFDAAPSSTHRWPRFPHLKGALPDAALCNAPAASDGCGLPLQCSPAGLSFPRPCTTPSEIDSCALALRRHLVPASSRPPGDGCITAILSFRNGSSDKLFELMAGRAEVVPISAILPGRTGESAATPGLRSRRIIKIFQSRLAKPPCTGENSRE